MSRVQAAPGEFSIVTAAIRTISLQDTNSLQNYGKKAFCR